MESSAPRVFKPPDFHWLPVGGGHIAVGHRPKRLTIKAMPELGITHVLTLLSEYEQGKGIGTRVERMGLTWFWLPLVTAKPPTRDRDEEIVRLFANMEIALKEEARIFIHCSAGIHRTGMISYGFLRSLGWSVAEAEEGLATLRPITGKEVGTSRKAWGDTFVQDYFASGSQKAES